MGSETVCPVHATRMGPRPDHATANLGRRDTRPVYAGGARTRPWKTPEPRSRTRGRRPQREPARRGRRVAPKRGISPTLAPPRQPSPDHQRDRPRTRRGTRPDHRRRVHEPARVVARDGHEILNAEAAARQHTRQPSRLSRPLSPSCATGGSSCARRCRRPSEVGTGLVSLLPAT
jgi:hypothetical protein